MASVAFMCVIYADFENEMLLLCCLYHMSYYVHARIGADGLAFVIQGVSPVSLGNSGSGLGYEGIANSLAVEIDTFHNFDQMDYYENHISILTQVRVFCFGGTMCC